ncbi:MAG: EscD/YscD/HrpQ family type III secretion system inner membrane ring protein [Desulfobacteraceae bacterium]|nr:EscD/YscD/HrpQ family type III secretion system inner membrane ring protein [Desulfobacteraceae bacterium]
MSTEDHSNLLKIYSGSHAGAELNLFPGEHLIGANEECDIILQDCIAENISVQITVHDDSIEFTVKSGKCRVGSQDFGEGESFNLAPGAIFKLGTACMSIGKETVNWEEFVESGSGGEADSDQTKQQTPDASEMAEKDKASEQDQNIGPEEAVDLINAKQNRKKQFFLNAGAMIALIVYGFYFFSDTASSSLLPLENAGNDILKINSVFKSLEITEAAVEKRRDHLLITGYVDNYKTQQLLLSKLKTIKTPTITSLSVVDSLMNAFKRILQNSALNLNVTYEGEGRFALHGFVRDQDLLKKILDRISNDLPNVKEILNLTCTHEVLIPALFDEITKKGGIKGKIELIANTDHVRVEGVFDPNDRKVWLQVKDALKEKYGKHIVFKEAFTVVPKKSLSKGPTKTLTSAERVELRNSIAGITLGKQRYINTHNGGKLFEGSVFPNGIKIIIIWIDRLLLMKNGNEVVLPLLSLGADKALNAETANHQNF